MEGLWMLLQPPCWYWKCSSFHGNGLDRWTRRTSQTFYKKWLSLMTVIRQDKVTAKALEELGDFACSNCPDSWMQWTLMGIYKKNSPRIWLIFIQYWISPIEFYIHHYKPSNSENLQAQIEFIEKIAPLSSKNLLSQPRTPIFICWRDYSSFWLSTSWAHNESRQTKTRKSEVGG